MKTRSRFRNYLSLEALVIVLVMISFRVIPDKKVASLVTSFLFLASTIGIIYWETRHPGFQKRPSFWGPVGFLIISVLPVIFMRLSHWDMPFDEVQVAGITGAEMHKVSNYVFILMMVCFFIDSYLDRVREREREARGIDA